jgi:amino-acid N-acetyltransferase
MAAIRALIRLYPRNLLQRDLPRIPSFFVALVGDRIVGCCALQIYSRRLAEVRSLVVHPDFQGRGIASRLLEQCQQRGRERGVKQLLVVTGEVTLFERLGFSTFRREKIALFYDVPASGS